MRRLMLRRSAAIALAVAASLGASACGDEGPQPDDLEAAESEAIYRNLSGLKYQVQISRQLNPEDPTDKAYFSNIAPEEDASARRQVWFGVFVRVENETDKPQQSARELVVEDTQGEEFEPVESTNTFAYEPTVVPPGGFIPNPEALQAQAGTQGALPALQGPAGVAGQPAAELTIQSPVAEDRAAIIDLDV
jgi:hypothetical protein